MRYEKLVNPVFLNPETMRCRGVKKDGTTVEIDFTVPEGEALGVNEYFDWICQNYPLTDIKAAYQSALAEHRARQQRIEEDKSKEQEIQRLTRLFDVKSAIFELQFIKEASSEVKSSVRRCPDEMTLHMIVSDYFRTYLSSKNLDYGDYLDYVEEIEHQET